MYCDLEYVHSGAKNIRSGGVAAMPAGLNYTFDDVEVAAAAVAVFTVPQRTAILLRIKVLLNKYF